MTEKDMALCVESALSIAAEGAYQYDSSRSPACNSRSRPIYSCLQTAGAADAARRPAHCFRLRRDLQGAIRPVCEKFFNDTATTEIYTLSLHDALPISCSPPARSSPFSTGPARLRKSTPKP